VNRSGKLISLAGVSPRTSDFSVSSQARLGLNVNFAVAGSHVEASRYVATPSRIHTGGLSTNPLTNWMAPWCRSDAVNAASSLGKHRSSERSGSDHATKTKSVRVCDRIFVR